MTAAGGIVHEEFHGPSFAREGGTFEVIQLWVNLPARTRWASRAISHHQCHIPRVELDAGAGSVRVIAGSFGGMAGPARSRP